MNDENLTLPDKYAGRGGKKSGWRLEALLSGVKRFPIDPSGRESPGEVGAVRHVNGAPGGAKARGLGRLNAERDSL